MLYNRIKTLKATIPHLKVLKSRIGFSVTIVYPVGFTKRTTRDKQEPKEEKNLDR